MTFFQKPIPQGDNVGYLKDLSKKVKLPDWVFKPDEIDDAKLNHEGIRNLLAEAVVAFVGTETDHYELMQVKTILKDPNDKWLALSAMQKAIRRGNSLLAMKAAHSLHAAGDWQHCWRRLAVIALEDIGLAAPDVVAMTLHLASNKITRDKLGWKLVLAATVRALCESLKSRALTYAVWWGSMAGTHQKMLAHDCLSFDDDGLLEMAMGPKNTFGERLVCFWSLIGGQHEFAGEKKPGYGVSIANGFISQMKLPPLLVYLMLQGRATANDALYIAIPLVHEMMMSGPVFEERHTFWKEDALLIGNKYAASIDQYTQIGRQVISYFIKKHRVMIGEVPPGVSLFKAIAEIIFFAESGVLNRIAECNGYWRLYWGAFDDWSETVGFENPAQARMLLEHIYKNLHLLDEVRVYLMSNV